MTAARAGSVFRENLLAEFSFLKSAASLLDATARAVPVDGFNALLLPVCELHATDDALVALLARWRSDNQHAYPTRFTVTDEGTKSWLRRGVLDVPDRLLFLVLDRHGYPVGHLGFANCVNDRCVMEIDNVVRGSPTAPKGLMTAALETMLAWAHRTLWPESFALRVLEGNGHAVAFYRKRGFVECQRTPLRSEVHGDRTTLVPQNAADPQPPVDVLLTMARSVESPESRPGSELILTAGPSISAREIAYATDAVRTGWNSQWGHYLEAFGRAFAGYVGVKHALPTSSCTGALHIALAALGIGPGDEVIVPDITWVATANAVLYVGATPVFADVQPSTWCLDPDAIGPLVTPRTRAVIPVHLYGHPAEMGRIMDVASAHGLRVVEDAAPSIGAEVQGRRTGSFGDFSAFSFQGAKLAVTGEGGMLLTNDDDLFERARVIWDQGRQPGTFWIRTNGLKYKMANPLAAIGLGQLQRNDALVEAKRRIYGWYREGLADVPHLSLNGEAPWARSICWMTSILLEDSCPVARDEVIASLKRLNVDTRPVFPAISQYPIWPRHQAPQPVAKRIGDRGINLPSGVCLSRSQVDHVCRAVGRVLHAS